MHNLEVTRYDVVLVASGGLDSAILAYRLVADGKRIRLIYLDYGKQCSPNELGAVRLLSHRLGIPLEVVDVRSLGQMQQGLVSPFDREPDELDSV